MFKARLVVDYHPYPTERTLDMEYAVAYGQVVFQTHDVNGFNLSGGDIDRITNAVKNRESAVWINIPIRKQYRPWQCTNGRHDFIDQLDGHGEIAYYEIGIKYDIESAWRELEEYCRIECEQLV